MRRCNMKRYGGMGTLSMTLLATVQSRSKGLVIRRSFIALGVALALLLTLAGMVWASERAQEGRPGRPIIVRWSTESEVNTAGFNVYRSGSENGPWAKLNTQLIPGSPDPLRGGAMSLQTRMSLRIRPIGTNWRKWNWEVRPLGWSAPKRRRILSHSVCQAASPVAELWRYCR